VVISKISLGTAQLGMNYGIANVNGKPEFKTAINILDFSWKHGINTFDTAPVYGNSEKIIGSFISTLSKKEIEKLIIISKLPKLETKCKILEFDTLYFTIRNQIQNSIKDLGIEKIPIYLIHNLLDLRRYKESLVDCLVLLKKEKLIGSFGVSVYTPQDIYLSLGIKEFNVIQLPINIFDHRFINLGLLKKLKEKNYIVLARSIYLQGLLFIEPKNIPPYLSATKSYIKDLLQISKKYNIKISKLAFLFVRDLPNIDSIIIGSENLNQLAENIQFLNEPPLPEDLKSQIFEKFANIPEKIINPTLWNKFF